MIKYVLHCCPDRMRYVGGHLIPAMQKQGISSQEIFVYVDTKGLGNLGAFMDCCRQLSDIPDDQFLWHMQDDVAISSDFAYMTETIPKTAECDIYCGFYCGTFGEDLTGYIGKVPLDKMWYSFQLLGLKNKYMKECADWFFDEVLPKGLYAEYVRLNKYDDTMFKEFMKIHYPHAKVLNIVPNLVDHVDVLIGGSIINKGLPWRRSIYFEDEKVVQDLIEELK